MINVFNMLLLYHEILIILIIILKEYLKLNFFIDQHHWKDIEFPPTSKDWKKLEQNNETALNILYVPHNTRKIQVAYKSKNNLTCDKQVILLMITNGEKWDYLTVKNLPGLLRGIRCVSRCVRADVRKSTEVHM